MGSWLEGGPDPGTPASDAEVVDVVAGVIVDARGRILLTQRTAGRDLAGLWEFPGGKREPGESAEDALARELHEELGIAVEVGAPLIVVPQAYPHKRLRLDVHRVRAWRGTPHGHEGQALAWVPPERLADYAMPPADRPVVAALRQPDRYLVTPDADGSDADWLSGLEGALAAGVRRVQARLPGASATRRRALVTEAAARCRDFGAALLVNADVALAQALGLGVHLRAAQLADLRARPLPSSQAVAASCHGAQELAQAQALGCDFVVLGPLRPTPTHPEATGLGWAAFAALRETASLPIYAIGGLGPEDVAEARRHGAQGVAAIRGLWPAPGR